MTSHYSDSVIIDKIRKLIYDPVENPLNRDTYRNIEADYLYNIYYNSAQKIYNLCNKLYDDVLKNGFLIEVFLRDETH